MNDAATAVPLTEAQSGLWYAQRLDPDNPMFNTGQYIDLRGPLRLDSFRAAVDGASAEADSLALRFTDGADGPRQWLDKALTPRLQLVDLSAAANPEEQALADLRAAMATPLVPERGPLARQTLYRLADDHHIWAQQVHHFAIDGYGMVLLTARVAELYALNLAGEEGGGRPLQPLAAVLSEDSAYRAAPGRAADALWWRQAMAGMAEVVGMAPGRAQSAHHAHRYEDVLPADTREALIRLAALAGVSWPDALTALVAAYCRRFAGTAELTIGVPHMGRLGSHSARVVAMVMNVLPLRVAEAEEAPLPEVLAAVAAATAEARRHGRYRSEQLRRDLGLVGGNRRLYGPLVNVQPYERPPRFPGLEASLHVTGTGPVEDISFTFRGDARHALSIEVDANPDLYAAADVAAHGRRLAEFLRRAAVAARLADVPTATAAEEAAEIRDWNATHHPLPDTTLTALLQEAFRANAGREALRFRGQGLSYKALDERSAALAGLLCRRGVETGDVVAVALPRSFDLVVALVAVLRAGAAFLPLDPETPPERLQAIFRTAKPRLVLADEDRHGLYGALFCPPADWPAAPVAGATSAAPNRRLTPADPAYVLYTSGSTGEPKGVVIEHHAIVNRLLWMRAHYGISPADRILQKTPATFDVSVWEFFLPLLSGAVLVVAPPGAHRDPAAIAALIRGEGITTLHFVPSMLAAFLDAPESAGLAIRRVFASGEELPAALRDRFHQRLRGELHNLYGPTEAAVDVSFWAAGPDDSSQPVPIGHPVWNTRMLLLDERQRPVPPGMAGELYLGGVQLARGYLGRPDLTAARFVADPFHAGERLYRTGDLARRRPDGAIVFLGRLDQQVKIRGLRIELGEIEAGLGRSGLVGASAVLARDGRLVAYVVPAEGDGYDEGALRASLARALPDYMIPSAFVVLPALPLTANGKLDRKALPAPHFASAGGAAPATATERRLAALYEAQLGLAGPLAASDDFFSLGGDSLAAVRLLLAIRHEWGVDPGLAALFDTADVRGLAAAIDATLAAAQSTARSGAPSDADATARGFAPLITLAKGDQSLPPLFLLHPAGGLCWGYRTLARALRPGRTVYGLQAPALDAAVPMPASIDEMAAGYVQRLQDVWPEGPCHLMGWSVGGILAQAMAVELHARGRQPGLVAMLDSYPAECWRAEPEPTRAQALRALLAVAGYDPDAHPELATEDQVLSFLRAGDRPLGNLPPAVLAGVVRVVRATNRLVRAHRHHFYAGTLTHIRAGSDHADRPQLRAERWAPHAAALDLLEVPFLHAQLTGAAASAQIAPLLAGRMAAFEALAGAGGGAGQGHPDRGRQKREAGLA